MTQRERVLRALRARGQHGITQLDFDGPTIDGLPPARRLASRIDELRAAGYRIDSSGRRHRMAVYVLLGEPEGERPHEAGDGAEAPFEQATFGDGIGTAPPPNPYDYDARGGS